MNFFCVSFIPCVCSDVCNGIAQLVHEYVYRDYVTSLSSSEGHTHYMQV